RVNAGFLYMAVVVAISVVALNLVFGMRYLDQRVAYEERERLRTENTDLAQKYEKLRWELADVSASYDELVEQEILIREMFDLPEIDPEQRLLGVGGPAPAQAELALGVDGMAYQNGTEIDRLNRLARFELEKFGEVVSALSDKKRRLNHTPSISPCRGWLSRGIGMKRNPFTGSMQYHAGIDLANHRGTPVVATADGKVTRARRQGGMGRMVIIGHGFGMVTRYGHLDKILVKPGQKVKRGDVIGLMGSSGYSTGPHLHYEVIKNGKSVNPLKHIIKTNF
ncbi:MAG: M23 family metallopeptidase, partial [Candidatus Zixiibacteriota bacterium]